MMINYDLNILKKINLSEKKNSMKNEKLRKIR